MFSSPDQFNVYLAKCFQLIINRHEVCELTGDLQLVSHAFHGSVIQSEVMLVHF